MPRRPVTKPIRPERVRPESELVDVLPESDLQSPDITSQNGTVISRAWLDFVAQCIAQNVQQKDITRMLGEKFPETTFSRGRTIRLINRVYEQWHNEERDPRTKDRRREQLLKGIEADELWLAQQRAAALRLKKPRPALAASFSRELRHVRDQKARIFGIQAPVEVNIAMTHTVQMGDVVALALASLTDDQATRMLATARENERLAAEMRKQLGEGAIDTPGEEVEDE